MRLKRDRTASHHRRNRVGDGFKVNYVFRRRKSEIRAFNTARSSWTSA